METGYQKKETENYWLFTDKYNKVGGIEEVLYTYRVTNGSFLKSISDSTQ